jgi:hypothetical protein
VQCRVCHQNFSPAEALKHEEQEREFEAFERSLYEGCAPELLEDVSIPDGVAPEAPGLTIDDDGYIHYPTAWMQPLCDRCHALDLIETVFYGWDGSYAYNLMHWYADGDMGCPKSPVMAYSWGLVRRRWTECLPHEEFLEECEADADYTETVAMTATLEPLLTAEERLTATALAEEVFHIAVQHGAIWV